ncbi:hypothetical protein FACS1894141_3520 [Spirochaetia bacterium]|nr:hypothetical protein FACS1894141_3520 [Spirochaetia bacterium]
MKRNKQGAFGTKAMLMAGMAALMCAIGLVLAGCDIGNNTESNGNSEAAAIAAITDAAGGSREAMKAALENNASALGLDLTAYNALSDQAKLNVADAMQYAVQMRMGFGGDVTAAWIKETFDSYVAAQNGGTGGTGGTDARATAIPLTDGASYTSGSITVGEVKWYSFTAAAGTDYYVSWEDRDDYASGSSYTADVRVTAYAGTSTTAISGFSGVDSGYPAPKTISGQSGTIYLKVYGYSTDSSGTFAIKYTSVAPVTSNSRETAIPLTDGTLTSDSITAGGEKWYSFTAAAGFNYTVSWEDSYQPSGSSYTADVYVVAYAGSSTTPISGFTRTDSGYINPKIISGEVGIIYLKVDGWNDTTNGTFAIKYTSVAAVPGDSKANAILLTEGTWANGEVYSTTHDSSQDVVWYKFSAVTGTTYNVWWNGSRFGNSTNTADIKVYKTEGNGGESYAINGGYTSVGYTVDGFTGTVYLRVVTNSSISTSTGTIDNRGGTFGIVYSTGSTRPAL